MTEPPERFATTNWSVVLAAGGNSSTAKAALEQLCREYWFPLYAFARRKGRREPDAKDCVQSFVANLLERRDLQDVCPEKGKFRSFLLGAFSNFLKNEYKHRVALKRGGRTVTHSIDMTAAENRMTIEPAVQQNPECAFEKEWGLSVIYNTLDAIRNEYLKAGKIDLFEKLSKYLIGDSEPTETYRETGRDLDLSELAVKNAVHRMRQRYRTILRQKIAATVDSVDEIDDEIHLLFKAIQSN